MTMVESNQVIRVDDYLVPARSMDWHPNIKYFCAREHDNTHLNRVGASFGVHGKAGKRDFTILSCGYHLSDAVSYALSHTASIQDTVEVHKTLMAYWTPRPGSSAGQSK